MQCVHNVRNRIVLIRNYIDSFKDGVLKVKPNMQTGELVLEDYKKIFDDKFYDTFDLIKINY